MFFGSEVLNSKLRVKPCLKLHEAAQNALVRLLKHTQALVVAIRASLGRLQDRDCQHQRRYEQVRQHARASAAQPTAS